MDKQSLETYLENEEVQWIGEPDPKFSITFLEYGGHYDAMSGPTSIFGLILGLTLVFSFLFYHQSNWLGLILTIIIGVTIMITPEYLKNQRKKNTKYALTKNKVIFQLWRFGKISMYTLDFDNIYNIIYERNKSGNVVYFIPKTNVDFYTYDFSAGERRHYSTFEMIADVDEVKKCIEQSKME